MHKVAVCQLIVSFPKFNRLYSDFICLGHAPGSSTIIHRLSNQEAGDQITVIGSNQIGSEEVYPFNSA